jgi:predicted ATPase
VYDADSARPYSAFPRARYRGQEPLGGFVDADPEHPVLTQIARLGDMRMADVARVFADMQRIDPSPALLRAYSQAYEIKRMGEHGENFAALIRMICSDPATKEAYLNWLRELRPRDVDDVGVLKGAIGEPMVMMKERGREWPAPTLSDGTLRFAAIAAAFFQPDMPGIITIEEIENGIHASRLRLLVELMRSQAAAGKTQVMVTTHSPIVLAWLKPEEYATTFYCKRDEETGESHICPLNEIPRFNEIVSRQPISDLFAEGWMETAL